MALNFNSLISDLSLNNQNSINRENDKNDTCDDKDYIIKELSLDNCDQWSKSGSETHSCAFSSDEQYFAWSSGFKMVTLVPKHNYLNKNAPNTGLTINCGDLVRSLLFVNIKDDWSNFWMKSAKCKQLFLVTGHVNGKIRIWDSVEGKLLLQLNDHKSIVTDLATTPIDNNLLISSSYDGTIKIRDLLNEGELVKTLTLNGQQIESVEVSSNNQYLAAAGSVGIVFVWKNMKNNDFELINKFIGHRHRISSLSFSPDNYRLASVSYDSTCMLWNVRTGQKIAQYNHLNPEPSYIFASGDNGFFCRSVCFAPDNHHLLTVCDNNCNSKLRIWDQNDSKPLKIFEIIDAIVCKYSPSGSVIAVGTKNGSVFMLKNIKCVKSLLSLCRTEILKSNLYKESMDNQRTLPEELINYLNYYE